MSRAWAKSPRIAWPDEDGEPRGHEQREGAEEGDEPLFLGALVVAVPRGRPRNRSRCSSSNACLMSLPNGASAASTRSRPARDAKSASKRATSARIARRCALTPAPRPRLLHDVDLVLELRAAHADRGGRPAVAALGDRLRHEQRVGLGVGQSGARVVGVLELARRAVLSIGADEQHLAEHEDGDERDTEDRQQPVLTGPRSRLGARLDRAHWSDWLSAAIETAIRKLNQ